MVIKSFLDHFSDFVESFDRYDDVDLQESVDLRGNKASIPLPDFPVQIQLGSDNGKRLILYPENRFNKDGSLSATGAYLLIDPENYLTGIGGFIRIASGDSLLLGREDQEQSQQLGYTKQVAKRHLNIKVTPKNIKFADKSIECGSSIAALTSDQEAQKLAAIRFENLDRLAHIFPGPLQLLENTQALELLDSVIDQLEHNVHQCEDSSGRSGGLITLPEELDSVFLGDLHANVDNLLVILSQNHFLVALEKGTAALIVLGDAVHPDEYGMEHEMESSMLIMDLILTLMKRFPNQVYYIRGNHDAFSEEIAKRSVPQGVLWKKALLKVRGPEYLASMERFYNALPYAALSSQYFACHAGAPTCKISRQRLINIRQHPELEHQIVSVRPQKKKALSGYGHADIKRARKQLELDPETPFVVGHTPLSDGDTMWLNAGDIPNHHVLFGACPTEVGVIVFTNKRFLPLRYPAEPLQAMINEIRQETSGTGTSSADS